MACSRAATASVPIREADAVTSPHLETVSFPPVRTSTAFAALFVRRFRILFTGGLIAAVGMQAQVIARGWLANDITGSNTGLGGVFMAFGGSMVLATPFGGVAADRYSKRMILIATQLVMMLTAVWTGLAVTFDFIEYWMLLASATIQGVCLAFFGPSRMALNGVVVDRSLIMNAVVLSQVALNLSRIIGPAMAGVFISISWIGTAGTYYVAAALAVLGAVAYVSLDLPPTPRARATTSVRAEYADTLAYVRRERHVGLLVVVSFVVILCGFPFIAFLPRYATEILDVGAVGYGTLGAASAVGAVAIGWLIAGRGRGAVAWRIQAIAGFGFSVALMSMGLVDAFAAALVAVVFVGGASAGFQAMNNSLVLVLTDLEHHGRVQSMMMLAVGGFGMAALPLGALADAVGLGRTLIAMGFGVAAAMTAYTMVSGRVRRRFGEVALLS
jgi:MFS family permease